MNLSLWFRGLRGCLLLLIAFGFMGVLAMAAISSHSISQLSQSISGLIDNRIPITVHLGSARSFFNGTFKFTWEALAAKEGSKERSDKLAAAKERWDLMQSSITELRKMQLSPENLERLEKIEGELKQMHEVLGVVWASIAANAPLQTRSAIQQMDQVSADEVIIAAFGEMFKKNAEIIAQTKEATEKSKVDTYRLMFASAVLSLALLCALGITVVLSTTRRLSGVSQQLTHSSSTVSSSSGELSSSAEQLSHNSQEQASALEEASASLEQISGMVESNAKNAEDTTQVAARVHEMSLETQQAMRELMQSMEQILVSNARIEKLVKLIEEIGEKTDLIDEIVFQTRLLSFNASVEAERAGEHGRGFAVVAQEVGNLAQMSGKSALEISTIVKTAVREAHEVLTDNQTRVQVGASQCRSSAEKTDKVVEAANRILSGAEQILQACKEQSTGLRQVSSSVEALNQATQSNAAAAEQASATSESLSDQASQLNAMVLGLKDVIDGQAVRAGIEMQRSLRKPARKASAKAAIHDQAKILPMRKTPLKPVELERTIATSQPSAEALAAWDKL